MSKVLVTGGAGYIGSHAVYQMLEKGIDVVVVDNLSRGYKQVIDVLSEIFPGKLVYYELDLLDGQELEKVFSEHKNITGVMHFAAFCLVDESMRQPYKYFFNNVAGTATLLEVMKKNDVKNFVFSSTCNVYKVVGDGQVDESVEVDPPNPYGESKYLAERESMWYKRNFDFNIVIFRYFNVCGAHPEGLIGDSKKPSQLLMQNAVRGALDIEQFKYVYSEVDTPDGSPIRDYINVMDLADAHILALEKLEQGKDISGIYNLGTEKGNSVKQIVEKVMDVTGKEFETERGTPRKGEPTKLFADISKAKDVLGWEPKRSLEDSINSLVKWYQKHPNGWDY